MGPFGKLTTVDKVIAGLLIFKSYGPTEMTAEHDCIYAGCDKTYSDVDKATLEALGWFSDESDSEGWMKHFV